MSLTTNRKAEIVFARLNKNFVWHPGLSTLPRHDLILIVNVINESQRVGGSIVEYQSARKVLTSCRLGDGREQYAALKRAMERLKQLRFVFSDETLLWYRPRRKREPYLDDLDPEEINAWAGKHGVSPKRAHAILRRQQRNNRYKKRNMGCLVGVRRRIDGRISFAFDERFFKANKIKKYYTEVHLNDIGQLRTTPAIRLHLMMRAWTIGDEYKARKAKLTDSLGLRYPNPTTWRRELVKTVRAVEGVRNGAVDLVERPAGLFKFTPYEYGTGDQGEHEVLTRKKARRRKEIRERVRGDTTSKSKPRRNSN